MRDCRSHTLVGAGKVMTHPELLRLGRKQLILLLLFQVGLNFPGGQVALGFGYEFNCSSLFLGCFLDIWEKN